MRSLLIVVTIVGLEILCAHGCHAQQVIAGARTSHRVVYPHSAFHPIHHSPEV